MALLNLVKSTKPSSTTKATSIETGLIHDRFIWSVRHRYLRYRVTISIRPFFLVPWKSWLSSVRYFTRKYWKSHFLQGARITRPCLTGHPVVNQVTVQNLFLVSKVLVHFKPISWKKFKLPAVAYIVQKFEFKCFGSAIKEGGGGLRPCHQVFFFFTFLT